MNFMCLTPQKVCNGGRKLVIKNMSELAISATGMMLYVVIFIRCSKGCIGNIYSSTVCTWDPYSFKDDLCWLLHQLNIQTCTAQSCLEFLLLIMLWSPSSGSHVITFLPDEGHHWNVAIKILNNFEQCMCKYRAANHCHHDPQSAKLIDIYCLTFTVWKAIGVTCTVITSRMCCIVRQAWASSGGCL